MLSTNQGPLLLGSLLTSGPVPVWVLTLALILRCSYLEIQKTFFTEGSTFFFGSEPRKLDSGPCLVRREIFGSVGSPPCRGDKD